MTICVLLAAGVGSRLMPLTSNWPKCMFPVGGYPLLTYWLEALFKTDTINRVLLNTHYKSSVVGKYLKSQVNNDLVYVTYEQELLGTAGTLSQNYNFLKGQKLLVAHADNFSNINLNSFLKFHDSHTCPISMACFTTTTPETCGIVRIDDHDIVTQFFEKKMNPPSALANAAIYCFDPIVLETIYNSQEITDISTQLIPRFIGQIKVYLNDISNIDIGTFKSWLSANETVSYERIQSVKNRRFTVPESDEFKNLISILHTELID